VPHVGGHGDGNEEAADGGDLDPAAAVQGVAAARAVQPPARLPQQPPAGQRPDARECRPRQHEVADAQARPLGQVRTCADNSALKDIGHLGFCYPPLRHVTPTDQNAHRGPRQRIGEGLQTQHCSNVWPAAAMLLVKIQLQLRGSPPAKRAFRARFCGKATGLSVSPATPPEVTLPAVALLAAPRSRTSSCQPPPHRKSSAARCTRPARPDDSQPATQHAICGGSGQISIMMRKARLIMDEHGQKVRLSLAQHRVDGCYLKCLADKTSKGQGVSRGESS